MAKKEHRSYHAVVPNPRCLNDLANMKRANVCQKDMR